MRPPWFNPSRLLVQLRHLICRGLYEGQNALVDLLQYAWGLTGCPEPAWMRDDPGVLVNGPADAPATILLAPGSSEPADSRFMRTLARGLARKGWRVIRLTIPMSGNGASNPSTGGDCGCLTLQSAVRQLFSRKSER